MHTSSTPLEDGRSVFLSVPATPDYVALARLALSGVCWLSTLSREELADLKLAVTEAAESFVDEGSGHRLDFRFSLAEDELVLEVSGSSWREVSETGRSLARSLLEATVDESRYGDSHIRLFKRLRPERRSAPRPR